MSDAIYQLRDVRKQYNGRVVLQVDHLDIHRGEIFALVGPSGAGKSTLLRLLNFLEPPSSGIIRFGDAELSPARTLPLELRRQVTMVFQRPILLNRSVWANVTYGLWLRGQQDSKELVTLPFKVKHRIDHVFKHPGAGQQSFLCYVPDQKNGNTCRLGQTHQLRRAFPHLTDTAWSGGHPILEHCLNGIDNDHRRRQFP